MPACHTTIVGQVEKWPPLDEAPPCCNVVLQRQKQPVKQCGSPAVIFVTSLLQLSSSPFSCSQLCQAQVQLAPPTPTLPPPSCTHGLLLLPPLPLLWHSMLLPLGCPWLLARAHTGDVVVLLRWIRCKRTRSTERVEAWHHTLRHGKPNPPHPILQKCAARRAVMLLLLPARPVGLGPAG